MPLTFRTGHFTQMCPPDLSFTKYHPGSSFAGGNQPKVVRGQRRLEEPRLYFVKWSHLTYCIRVTRVVKMQISQPQNE